MGQLSQHHDQPNDRGKRHDANHAPSQSARDYTSDGDGAGLRQCDPGFIHFQTSCVHIHGDIFDADVLFG
jgi:hypothetical protein